MSPGAGGRFLAALLVALLAAQLFALPVGASHNTSLKWATLREGGYDNYVRWKFHSSFPTTTAMRTYVSNGRKEWNNVNRQLHFSWFQADSSPRVIVTWSDMWWPNSGYLAIANESTGWAHLDEETRILSAEIVFNSSPDDGWQHWYGQTTSPSCAQKYADMWSTATHEFGHLVSLEHSNLAADTMAPTIPCGSTEKRSLTLHDRDGIRALYPAHY